MINVKVKTLDSQNHEFSVDDEITVKQFKEQIKDKVNITADLQRLIYCGRVLHDEKQLKEYDVNGKCLHLVQRPPPSTSTSGSADGSTDQRGRSRFGTRSVNLSDMPNFENLMMGSFSIPVSGNIVGPPHTTTSLNPSSTLCGNRITVARHMLQCADNIGAYLENPENGLNSLDMDMLSQQTMESTVLEVGISAVTDADINQAEVQNIVQAFQGAVSAAFRQNGISNITVQQNDANQSVQMMGSIPGSGSSAPTSSSSSSITIEFPAQMMAGAASGGPTNETTSAAGTGQNTGATTTTTAGTSSRRQQTTSTQTLGEVVGQMQAVQRRLDPFIQQYYDILQNDPTYEDDTARDNAQRVFDRVSEALHYMSHAQHAISDLMLCLSGPTPRHLCCRPILVEQSAFVSSGIAQVPPSVGSINIGPIFARGNVGTSTGNNNNNNDQPNGQINFNNNNNNENPIASFLQSMGLGQPSTTQTGTSSSTTNTTPSTTTAGSNQQGQLPRSRNPPMFIPISMSRSRRVYLRRPSDHDDEADAESPSDSATQANRDRYRNLFQSILNGGQPNAEVHIINANISVPVPTTGSPTPPGSQNVTQSSSPTGGSTENLNAPSEPAQARVNSNTQPTTSTQTRSTSRPILTSTTLPPTSIRNLRPIPANILSSFDRFLPCNSHHIRDSNSNLHQQQQNQQTQTVLMRPGAQLRTVSLDRNSVRQQTAINVPSRAQPSGSSSVSERSRSRRITDGVTNITDEELNHNFSLFGIQLRIRDLDNLEPSFYNAQRDDLRSFLRQNYFLNCEINDQSIAGAIRNILAALDSYLDRLSGFQHQDFDVRKSIENLIMKTLPIVIALITDDDSSEFGTRMERHLVAFCENVYMILVKCIGIRETERYLNEIGNLVMKTGGGSMGRFPRYIIQTFLIERRSYDLSEIQEFLIIKRPSAPTPIAMEVDEEPRAVSPMTIEDSEPLNGNIQSEDLLSEPLPNIDRAEPWHAQFSSNWLPIITRDMARQRRQSPQRPFSDTYISGMSSKRRKLLQSKKPSTNVQQLVADGVRTAVQTVKKSAPSSSRAQTSSGPQLEEVITAISSDPAVQSAYREEVKSSVAQRLKNDPDYDPDKYPNTSKYFK